MITEKNFIKLIEDNKKYNELIDKLDELLGNASLFEIPVVSYGQNLFEDILRDNFDKEAFDDITWWLYDTISPKKISYPDGTEKIIETSKDLWDEVKDHRK